MRLCRLLIFFKNQFFEKFFQEYHLCQTVWNQIRPDILSGLIWVQTVCKGYQQMTLVGKGVKQLFIGAKTRFNLLVIWPVDLCV